MTGQEAQEKILKEQPDVILLDLSMPGINGWEVLVWLRKEQGLNIPTIIISAKDEIDDVKKSYTLEADHYIIKPVRIKDIVKGIETVCLLKEQNRA